MRNAGETNSQAKLTERDVRAMRLLYATGEWSGNELAKLFRTSPRNSYKILDGSTWNHVK
jgi:hypothetical protein